MLEAKQSVEEDAANGKALEEEKLRIEQNLEADLVWLM